MSKIMIDEATVKLALEALEYWDVHGKLHQPTEEAIIALKTALAEQPAQRKPLPYNKEDMKDLDVNQRLAFKLGWKSAEEAHGIKEST